MASSKRRQRQTPRCRSVRLSNMLSDADMLDLSGEASLEDVRELNLRSQQLASIEGFAPRLPNLLALSLSHNRLTSLSGCHNLRLLTSLNINFNALTSLEGIQVGAAEPHDALRVCAA